jgi:hypothetical protein
MKSLSKQPWLRTFLVGVAGKPNLKAFDQASMDLKGSQEYIFNKILSQAKETAFGKEHRFASIKTVEDYRKAVRITDFEGHRPYVDRMCKGEENVLIPGKPVIYNTTSGTSGSPKLIPMSQEYLDNVNNKLTRIWLYTCLRDNPTIYNGQSLSAVAPAIEGHVSDGTPFGSISGLTYQNIPSILKSTYSTPYPIICIKNYQRKYYAVMRYALASDITLIISPSPSNIIRLHQIALDHFEDLVRDIRDGTLRKDAASELTTGERQEALSPLKPDPKRARFLEDAMSRTNGRMLPKHYWPNLACINVWLEGNFSMVIPKLDGMFPERTVVRSFGYSASEARAGIVLGNDWEHSVLACNFYHFEFIEENSRDQQNPLVLSAHEIEIGKRYYIIFSNGTGLYRYDINDLVEVTGFYNQYPMVRFIRKGEGVTSLTGEKLTELQVITAVKEVSLTGAKADFFVMFCDEKELCYKLFVEFFRGATDSEKLSFAAQVDRKLMALNREYEIKRNSERLAAPLMKELGQNAYEKFKEKMIAAGMAREGQYKDSYLRRKPEQLEILNQLAI